MFPIEFYNKHYDAICDAYDMYSSPDRYYHNFQHVLNMVNIYMELVDIGLIDYSELTLLAILFHDVVYDPTAIEPTSEDCSAAFASSYMRDMGYSDIDVHTVQTFILSTKKHKIQIDDPIFIAGASYDAIEQLKVFLDIDLYGLTESWEVYSYNGEMIWMEFQSHYSLDEFMEGRKLWIKRMLNMCYDNILFKSDVFDRASMHAAAIDNLYKDLQNIKGYLGE